MMESGERDIAMSAPRDVPIRDSAPPSSSRTFGRSLEPAWSSNTGHDVPQHPGADVWRGAMSRLQTQVSLNTSMLESHRRQLDILKQDMGNVVATLHEIQMELRAKPSVAMPSNRHDPGDLDLLVGQVEAVTSKANEVDAIKLQLDLMKNRMKRLEEQSVAGQSARPGTSTSATHRESSIHETPGPLHHVPYGHAHQPPPPQHQPLPPMRTSSMASPMLGRPVGPQPPIPSLEQSRSSYPPPQDSRHYSGDSSTMQPSPVGGYRPSEPLPPPSSLPGWRSSESLPPSSGLPAPQSIANSRPPTMEPDSHASGWASINAGQAAKRPYEEPRASPYESPASGSPKRPKLAPIMPRSSYGDDSYVPSSVGQSIAGDSSAYGRSRATSEVSQSQSQSQIASTPASNNGPSYRFITSTAQADSQESWRPEHERRMHGPHHHGHGHGHGHGPGHGGPGRRGGGGRGRGGGRGGRRGRGGGVVIPIQESQELGTPEWERNDWTGSQVSPNGYYHALHPYSPRMARGSVMRRGGGPGAGPPNRDIEPPQTPTYGPEDPSALEGGEGGQGISGGKKTRTKPIRNAEGILIRKDGRPDMRSVSSANNLRKVHAKKEAERAEMDGKTPVSARSLAPAHTFSEEEDDHDHDQEGERSHSGTPGTPAERDEMEDDHDHHHHHHNHHHHQHRNEHHPGAREHDGEGTGHVFSTVSTAARGVDYRFFPQHEEQHRAPEADMRPAPAAEDHGHGHERRGSSSQMTDVVMREMSEAQAAEHREREREPEDTKMAAVEEMDQERNHDPISGGGQAAADAQTSAAAN